MKKSEQEKRHEMAAEAMPQEAGSPPPEQGPESPKESIMEIAQQTGENLMKLSDMMGSAEGVTPQDQQKMQQIMSMYSDLVEKHLVQAPGQDPEAQGMSEVPVDQGLGGQPMGPQARN